MIKKLIWLVGVVAIVIIIAGVWWFRKTGGVNRFIDLAKEAACADQRNDVYEIDEQYIFWAREGSCADASYSYTLYDASPKKEICTKSDSIAGVVFECDEQEKMFKKMIKNLDQEDLGIGNEHTVKKIVIPQ